MRGVAPSGAAGGARSHSLAVPGALLVARPDTPRHRRRSRRSTAPERTRRAGILRERRPRARSPRVTGGLIEVPSELDGDGSHVTGTRRPRAASPRRTRRCSGGPTPRRSRSSSSSTTTRSPRTTARSTVSRRRARPSPARSSPSASAAEHEYDAVHRVRGGGLRGRARRDRARGDASASRCAPSTAASRRDLPAERDRRPAGDPRRRRRAAGRARPAADRQQRRVHRRHDLYPQLGRHRPRRRGRRSSACSTPASGPSTRRSPTRATSRRAAGASGRPRPCNFGDNPLTPADDLFACNNKLIAGAGVPRHLPVERRPRAGPEPYPTRRVTPTATARTPARRPPATCSRRPPVFGVERGPINGIAPGAWVAVYKVCGIDGLLPAPTPSAAVEQAILDGVDVINFSISGGSNPFTDPVELAFLDAYAAGVFVAASAGNDGPGAVHGRPPRRRGSTTVAASTQDARVPRRR